MLLKNLDTNTIWALIKDDELVMDKLKASYFADSISPYTTFLDKLMEKQVIDTYSLIDMCVKVNRTVTPMYMVEKLLSCLQFYPYNVYTLTSLCSDIINEYDYDNKDFYTIGRRIKDIEHILNIEWSQCVLMAKFKNANDFEKDMISLGYVKRFVEEHFSNVEVNLIKP